MFDGVGWAAGEIVAFIVVASLIGFAIGWIVGRWLISGTSDGDYEVRLTAENERADRADKMAAQAREEAEDARNDKADLQARIAELEGTVDAGRTAIAELETGVAGVEDLEREIERLTSDLQAQANLESELAARTEALVEAEAEVARLETELREAAAGAERAASEAGEREELARDLEEARARAVEAERLDAELALSVAEVGKLTERVGRLEAELDEAHRQVQTREAEPSDEQVDGMDVGATDQVVVAEAIPAEEAVVPGEPDPSQTVEAAGSTGEDGPFADDDLKMIHGIGPKLERTLKDLGITSYRQIANFQPDDIEVVSEALGGFKGRIERDDWLGGAAEQHLKKYGEPA